MRANIPFLFVAAALLLDCATTVRPEETTVAGHEALAAQQEKEAAELSMECDRSTPAAGNVCWTSAVHPSAVALRRAAEYRRMAVEHRAAAASLRDAEQQACVGISERDRDMSPFAHREDIASAEPLSVPILSQKGSSRRLVGATIVFRAVPGMTAEWLQRVVDCHLARNAAVGWNMPEMSYCPVAVKGATASVASTGNGFAVSVRSDELAVASEIAKRATALR
jgi:hypothetical protein